MNTLFKQLMIACLLASVAAATTNYYVEFASAIQYKNITAMQFHPEKSGEFGLNLLKRWLKS